MISAVCLILRTGGSVTINNNNPLVAPIINPNLLGSEVDSFIMREAVKSALRFAGAAAFADYVISPLGVNIGSTDAQLDYHIRDNTVTIWHPAGTASMSPAGATWGVVDPDLRVKGLSGLRIVDLSVVVSRQPRYLVSFLSSVSLLFLQPIRKLRHTSSRREPQI